MRFIVDEQLPDRLVGFIRQSGHEAEHVKHLKLGQAEDDEIWRLAITQSATVVSKDVDFVELIRTSPGASLVWVRTGNCSWEELLLLLNLRWPEVLERLGRGDIVVEVP